jgi:hypothetical protein
MGEDATVKDAVDTFPWGHAIMALGIVKQTEMYNRSAVLLSRGGTRNGGMDMTK